MSLNRGNDDWDFNYPYLSCNFLILMKKSLDTSTIQNIHGDFERFGNNSNESAIELSP